MIYTTKSPYNIVSGRAQDILDQIEADIQSGTISTQTELLASILNLLVGFNDLLKGSSMEIVETNRDDLLIRELVSVPIAQAENDTRLVFSQIENLRNVTLQIFNLCQAERAGLGEQLAELTSLVDSYRLWVTDSDPTFVWAGDSFNDTSKIDPSTTAFVEVHGGVATLQPTNSTSLSNKIVSAVIDRDISVGGIPGNSLEIQAPGQVAFTGQSPEPEPLLYGNTPPAVDSLASIFDGKPDTWFEWERVYIDPAQPVILAGRAFIYDPGGKTNYITNHKTVVGIIHISSQGGLSIPALPNWNCYIRWPGDTVLDTGVDHKGFPLAYFNTNDKITLRLGINITLDTPRVVSWLQLTPLIRGSAYPQIDQVLISSDGQHWKKLLSTPTILNPRINRGVDYSEFGTSASNFEGIGVFPFPPVAIKNVKILLSQPNTYDTQLGLAHKLYLGGKNRDRVRGPIDVVGSFSSTSSDSADIDFAQSSTETINSSNLAYDVFVGKRQMIGIRDLLLEVRTYNTSSQLVSLPFTLSRAVKSVSLLTNEKIPEDWEKVQPNGLPWITYEVSADGNVWSPITPQNAHQLENSVVQFPSPTTTVYMRATFSRPIDNTTESPVLAGYSLKMLPG